MLSTTSQTMANQQGVQVSLQELIDMQLKARELLVPVHRAPHNQWVGGHLSTARGRGMDFDEVRLYSPGDDVRNMDWRVTARSNKPHVKLYREERERPVFLVVDFSPTMFFGTRVAFKSVIAARAAALVAWAAVLAGDRVGAMLFGKSDEIAIAPRARQFAVLPMLKALADCTVQESENSKPENTAFAHVLQHLRRVAPAGSMILLLSDFEQADSMVKRHMTHLAQHHQLVAGLIYDPFESQMPDMGQVALSNGKERLILNTSSRDVRASYHEQFMLKVNDIKQFMTRHGQSFFTLATNQELSPVLHEVLIQSGAIRA